MIRAFIKQDLDKVMTLWLETNILAHPFIDRTYWIDNYDYVKKMMPDATLYIYEDNHGIQGFIGLMEHYIAGIFVSLPLQSTGIGKQLLDYVKVKNDTLSLHVYKENNRAVKFYLHQGFIISDEQIDKKTEKIELSMTWLK